MSKNIAPVRPADLPTEYSLSLSESDSSWAAAAVAVVVAGAVAGAVISRRGRFSAVLSASVLLSVRFFLRPADLATQLSPVVHLNCTRPNGLL